MDSRVLDRRQFLRSGVALLGGLGGCLGRPWTGGSADGDVGQADDGTPDGRDRFADLTLGGERLAGGFSSPVGVTVPRAGRAFVVDQPGQVYLVDEGTRRDEPFLDVSDRLVADPGTEQGLLGVAFHPDYADDGRLFVRYSAPVRGNHPDEFSHAFVLSEFSADPSAGVADPDSERRLLEIPEPQANHNAGAVTFGPDGYLYVAVGDGGAGGDQGAGHVEDWYDPVDGGNGQDVTGNLLGSILRIDVDDRPDGEPYAVPDDNPLVDREGRGEQFAWGFRNPWRMSFGPDGRLFAADVGQNAYEEVDVVEKGGNYGWNVREGTHCFRRDTCPDETSSGEPLLSPVIEYPHDGGEVSGISVIGGYLYDGAAIPALDGTYVFADWRANGHLFVARERETGQWPTTAVPVENVGPNVLSFGRDAAGELLVCTTGGAGDPSGTVYRLREA